ncbi:MAG: hypothetical protein JNG85_06285 [Spirochaetaceae bacterium]|nr:hypothetical protein [Spirochaetaceae bacterium]
MQKQAFFPGRPLALLALVAFASCATPPAAAAPATPAAGGAPAVSGSAAELEAEGLAAKARAALDSNHLAEAIRFYVSVIAIHGESPSAGTKARADAAAAELQKIGQRLSIEPGSEWFDAKGGQVAGDARGLGKEGALFPSVYLYENFGAGKSPVADAPIYFEFLKNSGSIISLVTTDPYGKANTTIAKLDEPGKEALVRAYPLFRARGSSYVFKSVFRDFSYLPPANIARVIVLETSESGASDNPQTVDAVVQALKPLGLQFVAFNGKLADDAFKKAFGGDRAALGSFGADAKAPYVAFVLVEADKSRQMELNGKKYNIFTTQARATFRLIRADGTVVYALPLDGIKGQGGTPEAAALDGIKRAREALVPEIEKRLEAMKSSLYRE